MPDSRLYPGEQIIDDSTLMDNQSAEYGRGYKAMFRSQQSANEITSPFPQHLLIPPSDWQAWIQDAEKSKSQLSTLALQAGLNCKNQEQTSLCWGNAPTHLVELNRVIQNQPLVTLSPASVCGPVNGFRNEGGYGEDALRQLIQHGAVPTSIWPANAIDRRYYTEANKAIAMQYRCTEWWRLQPHNLQEHISCLLRRIPIAVGLGYWGHEVSDYEAVWVNGQIGVRYRNSWSENWPSPGAHGFSIRQGNKILADDAVCIRASTAS